MTRRGFLLPLILLVIFVLSVFGGAYFWMSRNAQLVASRMAKAAICRYLCEAAMDEALFGLYKESRKPGSTVAAWFIDHPATPLPLETPMVAREAKNILPSTIVANISTMARMHDFRNVDSARSRYYGKEGVGAIQVTVHVELADLGGTSQAPIAVNLLRQFDFKVVSMVSARDNTRPRNSYCQNFLLDYGFFVRRGADEFVSSQGELTNPGRVQISVAQAQHPLERRGKIYFGGTSEAPSQRFVFLNTVDADQPVLPRLPNPEVLRIDSRQCLSLFPEIRKELQQKNISESAMQGVEGVFVAGALPLLGTAVGGKIGQIQNYTRGVLFGTGNGPAANRNPGAELIDRGQIGVSGCAASLLEGAVRQRFLYFVYFYIDASKADPQIAQDLQKEDLRLACVPMPNPPPQNQNLLAFLQGLQSLPGAGAQCPFLSRIDSDYLYAPGLSIPDGRMNPDSFGKPAFFDKNSGAVGDSSESLQGWFHVNLMGRRMLTEKALREIGTIDETNKTLNLNGNEWVAGDLTIGNPGEEYTVCGKGVLLANGNIRINAAIRKRGPEDMAVFFTRRGLITVAAPKVEASLVALGTGANNVVFLGPAVVRGAFAVDVLNPANWAPGKYRFEYDPLLKGNQDQYVINLTTAHSFQRFNEGEP